MEVPAGQDGIQRLLAAEQDAQAVVATARKAKAEQLRKAKEQADNEVAAYKSEREADYERRVSADSSSAEETAARLRAESEGAVTAIRGAIASRKEEVLSMLMKHVTTVAQK